MKGRGLMPREWYKDPAQQVVGHCRAPGCGVPMVSDQRFRTNATWFRSHGMAAHKGKGLCQKHLARLVRTGTLAIVGPRRSDVETIDDAAATARECADCRARMVYPNYIARFPELLERGLVRAGGRGYCKPCYYRHRRAGEFEGDRRGRPIEETLEDWVFLRDDGVPLAEAARRMGMTEKALDKALYRARKKGDPRGSLYPFGNRPRRAAA